MTYFEAYFSGKYLNDTFFVEVNFFLPAILSFILLLTEIKILFLVWEPRYAS
jgi:hypothetical protein